MDEATGEVKSQNLLWAAADATPLETAQSACVSLDLSGRESGQAKTRNSDFTSPFLIRTPPAKADGD